MIKKITLGLATIATLALTSCATVSTPIGMGGIYTGVQQGEAVTANPVGQKVDTAEAVNVLGIVAIGDASITAAAKKAGITKISHVDSKRTAVLGIFSKYTIYVYGD